MTDSEGSSDTSKSKRPPRLTSLRQRPTDETDQNSFIDDLERESDKGLAILASADLDSDLEAQMIKFMEINVELDLTDRNMLFGESGPLVSLNAKSRLGYAMGLYGKITRDDIFLMAKIRNAFAHSPRSLGFDNPLIAESCQYLRALASYKEAGLIPAEDFRYYESSHRLRFTFTALIIPQEISRYFNNKIQEETSEQNMLLAYLKMCDQSDKLLEDSHVAKWVRAQKLEMLP